MATDVVRNVLANLGIHQRRNSRGKAIWVLEIMTDRPTRQKHKAFFDETVSKWKLEGSLSEDEQRHMHHQMDAQASAVSSLSPMTASELDGVHWTDALPQNSHTDFFRATDWAATPLGSLNTWEHALRLYTHMLLADSRSGIIWWGPHRTAIYNQSMLPFMGRLHPSLMGQPFETAMPDEYPFFSAVFHAMQNNQPISATNGLEVALERHGYVEETWWDATLLPLKNDLGTYGGAYFSWLEVTRTVLQDRRTALINRLEHSLEINSSLIWDHIHKALAESPRDIPMAIIYGVEDSESNSQRLHLKHTIGISEAYTAAPAVLDLHSSSDDPRMGSLFCHARDATADYTILDLSVDQIHPDIISKVNWLGHNQASRHLAIIPLRVKKTVKGFILLALNPRRGFDKDHEHFVSELTRQLTNLMTRIATEEENQKREEYLVKELTDSERRLSKMAEAVPVGIYDLAADGSMLWANTSFFNIIGVPLDSRDPKLFDWRDYIIPEDQSIANAAMGRCLMEKVNISDSLRLKKKWVPPGTKNYPLPADEEFWILYSASPDVGADGSVRSLMGCVTDISHLKWAEQLQARIADTAEKEKRKQEEFIDITSHEIRNPLSAITQCADSIIASFQNIKDETDARSLVDIIKMNVEDAESILFCTVHQRRIINDILTLGKLDSGLLTVAPISFHPRTLVDEALQMFKAEFEASQIDVQVVMDQTSVLSSEACVRGDCARMMQILVNLLTNAIKFTRTERSRRITIKFGSSHYPPATDTFGRDFHWNPTEKARPDLTQDPEYGSGMAVYLYYCVTDSGKGIPGEFANRVFSKFEQADRRTHTKYGGSGLGLFISRELAELQGGRIGVESREGVGSTFGFYTKAKDERYQEVSHFDMEGVQSSATDTESQKMENDSLYQTNASTRQLLAPTDLNYKILLVEDNILNQRVLAKQLTKAGCVIHVANDGEEAIRFMQRPVSIQVDCILMDWEMPVCDGLTATKKIREIEMQRSSSRNVIIGITANARSEQLARAIDAGMDSIVPKPFRVPELLAKIGEYVGSRRAGH